MRACKCGRGRQFFVGWLVLSQSRMVSPEYYSLSRQRCAAARRAASALCLQQRAGSNSVVVVAAGPRENRAARHRGIVDASRGGAENVLC